MRRKVAPSIRHQDVQFGRQSSGGRRVSHAARTSGAVTVGPASKRGGPRQWRVHLSVRTSTAIQRRAPGAGRRGGRVVQGLTLLLPAGIVLAPWRAHLLARAPPGARHAAAAARAGAERRRRSGAVRRAAHRSRHTRSSCRRCARWARRALGTVRGPQDHLLVMDPPVSLQAGDLRLRRFPLLRQRRRRRRRGSHIRLPGVRRRHVATSGSATIGPGQGRSSSGSRSGVTSKRPDDPLTAGSRCCAS